MNLRRILSVALTGVLLTALLLSVPAAAQTQSQSQPHQTSATLSTIFIKVTFPSVNVVWEKGKSYTVRWESRGIVGNVRIRLVSANRQVFELVGNVPNNGTHDCYVGPNLYNGVYKIQVMKMDYSVMGESAATVTIGAAKTPYAKVTSQAPQGKTPVPGKPLTKTGAATTTGAAGASSTGGTRATGATAAAGTTAPASSSQRGSATAASAVRKNVQIVRVSQAELKGAKLIAKPTVGATSNSMTSSKDLQGEIVVYSPKDGDVWSANDDVGIGWRSTAITGDVKITLESALSSGGRPLLEYPIVERTANTGSYRFHVPQNWLLQSGGWHVRVKAMDGKASGKSAGYLSVYTQNVDLACRIMDTKTVYEKENYVFYYEGTDYLEFNVWMRNYGWAGPINISDVLVRIIKEPEEKVVYQVEWGFGGIYPGAWYKLDPPERFNIREWSAAPFVKNEHIDVQNGAYRIEVTLDPQNLLGENPQLREDNKAVKRWVIERGK